MEYNWVKDNYNDLDEYIFKSDIEDLKKEIKMGRYPKSFGEIGLYRVMSDRLAEEHSDSIYALKIIYCYDVVLKFENELKEDKLYESRLEKIERLGSLSNYIGLYFLMSRYLLLKLKMRDDLVFTNDELHRISLRNIQSLLETKWELVNI